MIDFELENALQPHLSSDERLLWAGKPKGGIVFRSSDIFLIPFSLLWGGFAVFWESSVFFTGGPFFFKLWGIPFVAIGLYMIAGRFFTDAKKREKTIYGVTPERIIIVSGLFNQSVKSLNIRTLSDLTLSQKSDGSGTISFGPTDVRYTMMQGMDWPGVNQPPKFEMIENVKEVYDKIVEIQRQR